jgi:hypothetical protein
LAYIRKTPTDKREWFIEKANKKHNNKFEYGNTVYVSSHGQVVITCKEHGDFSTTATSHLAGSGCPTCGFLASGQSKRLSLKDFVDKANIVHSGFYDYSESVYTRSQDDIVITCPLHGNFTQKANSHLMGHGCKLCANNKSSESLSVGQEHFLARAKDAHGEKYDYSQVKFSNYNTKVCIICPIHREFEQMPKHHADGFGCSKCGSDVLAKLYSRTNDEFIVAAEKVHGQLYDYSLVDYKNSNTHVLIGCRQHGIFRQGAQSHLSGRGCRKCRLQGGYSQLQSGTLYIMQCGDMTKVGITNKSAEGRAETISKSFGAEFSVVKEYKFDDGYIPLRTETKVLQILKSKFKSPSSKFDGSTECFFDVDLSYLIAVIECEVARITME